MHSSRMRTIHCSGHLSCYACPLTTPPPPLPCMPPCHARPPPLPCTSPATHVPMSTDRRLWKHYFSATTVADGNDGTNGHEVKTLRVNRPLYVCIFHTQNYLCFVWPRATEGRPITQVRWCRSRPSVFFVLDGKSHMYIWDLLMNEVESLKKEKISEHR